MGRPSKLTAKRQTAICKALKHGASFESAAAVAGLHQSTFTKWRKRGAEENSGPYHNLVLAIEQAQAEGEAIATAQVFKSFTEGSIETITETLPGDGGTKTKTIERPADAMMALRWLERRCPQRWNLAHRVALSGDPDADPITIFRLPDNGRDTPAQETAGGASFADAPGRLDPTS